MLMKEISTKASLSKIYTNHCICKTTAAGMRKSGFSLDQITHITKYKNLDSLKHYVDGQTLNDKENYNQGLFAYANLDADSQDTNQEVTHEEPSKKQKLSPKKISKSHENSLVPVSALSVRPTPSEVRDVQNLQKINKQLRQAPNLFQNANFTNCNFTFTLPQ